MPKNSLQIALFIFLLGFATSSVGQKSITKLDGSKISTYQVDLIVEKLMTKAQVHGLSIAVINGNTTYLKNYGFKDLRKKELLNLESVLYGASLSKAVFAFLCLKLVEEGVLELDRPLYEYLKQPISAYADFAALATDENWKLITPRMCLNHTSGLPNSRWINVSTGEEDSVGTLKIYFKPGTRYAYSGEGIKLLQKVAEELTGKSIEELALQRIFKPFEMNMTSYVWQPRFEENEAIGHAENGDLRPRKRRNYPVASASLLTTIGDYAKFTNNVMQARGLRIDLWKEMLRPQIAIESKYQVPTITALTTTDNKDIQLSYGLGWGLFRCKYGRAFFKEGHDEAWRNYNVNFPDKKISITIIANSANGELIFKELLEKIIGDTCTPWEWERYVPYNQK